MLTARKEKSWGSLTEFEKKEFRAAAQKGWAVWTDNDAVEILPDDEAVHIRARLKAENQSHRILVPRSVIVDKNDGRAQRRISFLSWQMLAWWSWLSGHLRLWHPATPQRLQGQVSSFSWPTQLLCNGTFVS